MQVRRTVLPADISVPSDKSTTSAGKGTAERHHVHTIATHNPLPPTFMHVWSLYTFNIQVKVSASDGDFIMSSASVLATVSNRGVAEL